MVKKATDTNIETAETTANATITTGQSKREVIRDLIAEGVHSKAVIMEKAGVNKAVLASYISDLRMIGRAIGKDFPLVDDLGAMYMGTQEQYKEYEANRAKGGVAKPPKIKTAEEVKNAAQLRENKASTKFSNAKKKAEDNAGDEVFVLKMQIAELELTLASKLLHFAEKGDFKYESATIADEQSGDTDTTATDVDPAASAEQFI